MVDPVVAVVVGIRTSVEVRVHLVRGMWRMVTNSCLVVVVVDGGGDGNGDVSLLL